MCDEMNFHKYAYNPIPSTHIYLSLLHVKAKDKTTELVHRREVLGDERERGQVYVAVEIQLNARIL